MALVGPPTKLKLTLVISPEIFQLKLPNNNPKLSDKLPVKLTTSSILVVDTLRVILTLGNLVSGTVINVEFCFTLLALSVAYIVKLITHPAPQVISVALDILVLFVFKLLKFILVNIPGPLSVALML